MKKIRRSKIKYCAVQVRIGCQKTKFKIAIYNIIKTLIWKERQKSIRKIIGRNAKGYF